MDAYISWDIQSDDIYDAEGDVVGQEDYALIEKIWVPAADRGTGSSTKISTKTVDQVIRDFNSIIDSIPTATNEVEQANTVLMAPAVFRYISQTRIPDTDGQTILSFLQSVHPEITRWMKVGELKGAASDSSDMIVVGYFDPIYIKFEIPTRFDQLPVQSRNLEYVVNCVAEAVGVTVTMPAAFAMAKGA